MKSKLSAMLAAAAAVVVALVVFLPAPEAQSQPAEQAADRAAERAAVRAAYKAAIASTAPKARRLKQQAQDAKAAACLPQERAWLGAAENDEPDIHCLRKCTSDADCVGQARCVVALNTSPDDDTDEPHFAEDVDFEAMDVPEEDRYGLCKRPAMLYGAW